MTPDQARYTQCPACATLFRVETLPRSTVRCGSCSHLFLPTRRQVQNLPLAFKPLVPEAFRLSGAAIGPPDPPPVATDVTAPRPRRLPPPPPAAAAGRPAPVRRRSRPASPAWALGSALLMVVLLAQGLILQREALADHEPLRPLLAGLCVLAGCELRPVHDVSAWRLSEAELRRDPQREDALLATARLQHRAGRSLALPLLQLQILDAGGGVAHEGWFHAGQYVADADFREDWSAGLPAGEELQVKLRLRDPGMVPDQYRFRLQGHTSGSP